MMKRQKDIGTGPSLLEGKFASHGARRNGPTLFDPVRELALLDSPRALFGMGRATGLWGSGDETLQAILRDRNEPAPTVGESLVGGVSAGKNTYTYDAHTYHTKVPPQGIAAIISRYLPSGGVVLDPFAGSGMTGVAAHVLGLDFILNELSPAASFIADRYVTSVSPALMQAAVARVLEELAPIRKHLYTTECRECGKPTEVLYTVWSYRVMCSHCGHEFLLWDHCRKYGRTVREHKILSEFPCPACKKVVKKSRLQRTAAEPVFLGYKCCSRVQVEHPLTDADRERLQSIENAPPLAEGFYPTTLLPDGVNLGQPKRHGLVSVADFYTPRNLAAMSHLWRTIHRVDDAEAAASLAFAFTSLYQRVTRLAEYRFWGGSGNTANLNVPYIFNEANVFVTFARKANAIRDHLEMTAPHYHGRGVLHTGSATNLAFLPDDSVDLIFTDPPFGANINYSEMNLLWESWLDAFTDTSQEAIINRAQGKGVEEYKTLMRASLDECYRVLRPGHWMLLVFMNSNAKVWTALRDAIAGSGFILETVEIFDKRQGTFKQFVSENTVGSDLVLHCRKSIHDQETEAHVDRSDVVASIERFLESRTGVTPMIFYQHVSRPEEIDYRTLYSEWLGDALLNGDGPIDFSTFRTIVRSQMTE